MKFPRETTEKSLPCHFLRDQHRRWCTRKLRESMIAVPEADVGCGYELLAANRQSAYEAGVCEIGEEDGDCDLGGPVSLDCAKVNKTG